MKEAYVKFGTAQRLKEKGFYWDCEHYYKPNAEIVRTSHTEASRHINSSVLYEHQCLAPTQQMACRWLREVHNIFIGVGIGEDLDGEFGYMPFIHILDNLSCPDGKYVPDVDADDICELTPQTYEDAVEAALQYALTNLI